LPSAVSRPQGTLTSGGVFRMLRRATWCTSPCASMHGEKRLEGFVQLRPRGTVKCGAPKQVQAAVTCTASKYYCYFLTTAHINTDQHDIPSPPSPLRIQVKQAGASALPPPPGYTELLELLALERGRQRLSCGVCGEDVFPKPRASKTPAHLLKSQIITEAL
jgi:hypothetical protein